MASGRLSKQFLILAASWLIFIASDATHAANKGISFIGASRTSINDIYFVSKTLVSAGDNVQFAFLPFEFAPKKPFHKATILAKSTLPNLGKKSCLEMTVYLKWFPHDAAGKAEQRAFWNAWNTNRPNKEQRIIRQEFMNRIGQANAWTAALRLWAREQGLGDRLVITLVPVLEDECPKTMPKSFMEVLRRISQAQAESGMRPTLYRRSCLPEHQFRIDGVPLELHGPWQKVKHYLRDGDTWSNDGTHYDGTPNDFGQRKYYLLEFVESQREARRMGINVIYWDVSYNGAPKRRDNWTSRTVAPFTGSDKAVERETLRRIITAK